MYEYPYSHVYVREAWLTKTSGITMLRMKQIAVSPSHSRQYPPTHQPTKTNSVPIENMNCPTSSNYTHPPRRHVAKSTTTNEMDIISRIPCLDTVWNRNCNFGCIHTTCMCSMTDDD